MATYSQPTFQLLVANFSRPMPSLLVGADPVVAGPTKTRGGFVFGHVGSIGLIPTLAGYAGSTVSNIVNVGLNPFENIPPTRPTGSLTVASNTFAPGSATVYVGPFELVVYRDWTPGGGVNATATAIAAAITNLPGYDATAAVATVSVEGPLGAAPASLRFGASYRGLTRNFTLTYVGQNEFLGYTNSPLTIEILPTTPNHYPPP